MQQQRKITYREYIMSSNGDTQTPNHKYIRYSTDIGAHTILIYLLESTQQQQEVNMILNSYLNHEECHPVTITHNKHCGME